MKTAISVPDDTFAALDVIHSDSSGRVAVEVGHRLLAQEDDW